MKWEVTFPHIYMLCQGHRQEFGKECLKGMRTCEIFTSKRSKFTAITRTALKLANARLINVFSRISL